MNEQQTPQQSGTKRSAPWWVWKQRASSPASSEQFTRKPAANKKPRNYTLTWQYLTLFFEARQSDGTPLRAKTSCRLPATAGKAEAMPVVRTLSAHSAMRLIAWALQDRITWLPTPTRRQLPVIPEQPLYLPFLIAAKGVRNGIFVAVPAYKDAKGEQPGDGPETIGQVLAEANGKTYLGWKLNQNRKTLVSTENPITPTLVYTRFQQIKERSPYLQWLTPIRIKMWESISKQFDRKGVWRLPQMPTKSPRARKLAQKIPVTRKVRQAHRAQRAPVKRGKKSVPKATPTKRRRQPVPKKSPKKIAQKIPVTRKVRQAHRAQRAPVKRGKKSVPKAAPTKRQRQPVPKKSPKKTLTIKKSVRVTKKAKSRKRRKGE